jgi:hypothetical protein
MLFSINTIQHTHKLIYPSILELKRCDENKRNYISLKKVRQLTLSREPLL